MKIRTGHLARTAACILTAFSIAAVQFPSVSVYAEDASVSQQAAESHIGFLDPGVPRRGVNWSWDGEDKLSLYGVDMLGSGTELLFNYTGDEKIQVRVSGYNRIEGFSSMCSGETIAISGAGTLEAVSMAYLWDFSDVTVSDVYIKASGIDLGAHLSYSGKLTVESGYIDAPDMAITRPESFEMNGGYVNARLLDSNSDKAQINGGYLKLKEAQNSYVSYQCCVITVDSVDGDNTFELLEDNAVLYVGNGNINSKNITLTGDPKDSRNIGDARLWCHQYISDNTGNADYYGMYYSGTSDFDMNSGVMSGGNYFSTTGNLTVEGFSGKTTFVGSCESGVNVIPNQEDSTVIAEKGVLNISGDTAGKNIGIIGTDCVKLSPGSTADNVVAISSSDGKPALVCDYEDNITLSGHITAHHTGNDAGLYIDGILTINGEVSAYSANSTAINISYKTTEDYGVTLGDKAEISAYAPNVADNKVIIEEDDEVNDRILGNKVVYAGKPDEQMHVRLNLRVPDKDYDRFGYDRVHIGSELFFDFVHSYTRSNVIGGVGGEYTANNLSMDYKGYEGAGGTSSYDADTNLYLTASCVIVKDDVKVSVKNSSGEDETEKFFINISYVAYSAEETEREILVYLRLKSGETLDAGTTYTVAVEYNDMTVETEMPVTAYDTTLNFCLENDLWTYETEFLGIDKISRGNTWEWYGTAADGYKAHTLVLNNFDLYTTGKTLVIPQDTTIILKGENKLRSDTAVITAKSHDPGSVSIIGEEGSSIDLTAGKLSSGNFTSGAIDLFIYSGLYLKDCSMNITVLEPGGYLGDDVSGIRVKTFTAENSTLNVSAEGRMYAGVYAADKYNLIGSNSFSFTNTDGALRGSSMEPNSRSVLVSEMENIIDVDLDSFNQKVKKGDYVEWLFAEDYQKTVILKTQGITQTEPNLLLSGEDGEIVPGSTEDITLDLSECFEGGTGAYSIKLAPGAVLPDWVTFDEDAATLSITEAPDEFIDPTTVDFLVNDANEVLRESEDVKATVTIGAVVPKCTLTIVNNDTDHCLPHIDDQCYPNYPRGEEAHIKFKTDVENGWFVKTVTLNGVELTPDEDGMYIFKVEQDSELVVETEQRIRSLTVTTTGNGTVTPDTAEYIEGAEVTLTVTPDEGYQVKSVTLNGTTVELTNGKYTFTITEDSVFAVEFEEIPAGNVMLTITSGEGGKVTPGTTSYPVGTEVTLTVTPDEGYIVKSVTLNGNAVELTNGTYTFTITEESVFAAEFEKIPVGNVSLTVNCGEGGKVTPGTASYPVDTEVTLTVTPDEGYMVKSVTLNGNAVELTDGTYTFTITEDSVFAAEFEKLPVENVTLTVTSGEGGKVTPGTASYAKGAEVMLTVTPDAGYQVKSVTLNGNAVELTNGTYTFTITENSTFEAVFKKKTTSGTSGGSSGGGYTRPSSPAPAETNPAVNGKNMSWSDAASEIRKASPDEKLVIDLNGKTDIPAEVIKAAAERKLKVEFVIDSTKSWVIDGAEITAPANADLTALPGNADKSALRGISGFDLKISGTNVPADMKLSFRKEFAGQFANVYKLTDGKLVFLACAKIGEDGSAVISGMEASGEYIVMACEFSDLPGDANNDGVLNALDAAAILKAMINSANGGDLVMSDINGDGTVNALDAAAILKMIVG